MIVDAAMKIISADLLDQAFTPNQIPTHPYLQIAVIGRSNVGKSSLLATMMNRRKLVKVSRKPGKTRGVFYYLVNGEVLLVDLPGYGFSKAPKAVSSGWQALMEAYFDSNPGPSLGLHLIDIRHPPTRDDLAVRAILDERQLHVITVATKTDKLSRSGRMRSLKVISRDLGVPIDGIVPTSAKDSSISVGDLWDKILKVV